MEKFDRNNVIGVLYGGMSNEREVSLRSGKNVYESLKRLGYKNTILIDVDENIAKNLLENNVEVAYNALHGKYGEDGCIQGLLEVLKIPYTGCGVFSSSLCMNKDDTKKILASNGIELIKSVLIKKEEKNIKEKIKDLKYPLMLKPVTEGSSIGMVKVEKEEDFDKSFKESLKCNQDIMVEEFIEGISSTVGVLDIEDKTIATEILEFRTKKEWYDYECKYTEGMTEFILPAQFTEELTNKIKEIAINSHKFCKCKNVSRVDFLVDKNNTPYVLEINTSPGMTDLSDLPAQAKAIGLSYDDLVLTILNGASLNK